jgi:hypothetical protein
MNKIEISPGVRVTVNAVELKYLEYIKKVQSLPIERLNSDAMYVIKLLLSKGIITRAKKDKNVHIQLRAGIRLPKN